jgi:multiple sugar transport system substrate-binding protein
MSAFMQTNQEQFYARTNRNLVLINNFTRGLGERANRVMMFGGGGGDTSNDEIAGLIANDNGEVQFSYNMGFGINSNSENKRTAWEFLKFLASEEMQASGLARLDSIPVNNNARERIAAMSITGENMSRQAIMVTGMSDTAGEAASEAASGELTPEQKTALESYLNQLDKFTAQLNKHIIRDERIDNMIQDEVRHFFAGTRSSEEVANALQSRINLYLNE